MKGSVNPNFFIQKSLKINFCNNYHEKKLKTLEEKTTDEMEVAKKTSKKGKEKEKDEESSSRLVLQIIFSKERLINFNSNNIYKPNLS